MKRQYELPTAGLGGVFNLSGETGEDPFRVERDRWQAAERAREAAEYQAKMQLSLQQCPGFLGCDAPSNDQGQGRIVINPGDIVQAMAWLKRRYHVNENMDLSLDNGLVVEIKPRVRNSGCTDGQRKVKVSFRKPEQFCLPLNTESETTTI